ncbi:kinase-like domain-containing protein [Syncephalis pseudoplumigaleata]|uniref:Kinase-like domain-containing protein n=1 Tax=Syncephalis pseudoplumigaleata TaxID=1712513 RepID=A0A4P9YXA6_9FUNG|nr:kinase-like domain-containing protein [Syncephalis pseudoplumigaleata]|eukprot:RKP24706.1 kinase-like domain-containing protein [Syncephalis pseudoplumigaleata]
MPVSRLSLLSLAMLSLAGSMLDHAALSEAATNGPIHMPIHAASNPSLGNQNTNIYPDIPKKERVGPVAWRTNDKPGMRTGYTTDLTTGNPAFVKCFLDKNVYAKEWNIHKKLEDPFPLSADAACKRLPLWAPHLFVKAIRYFPTPNKFRCIVFWTQPGIKDLYDFITESSITYRQHTAYNVLWQLLIGTAYLHCKGISHGDIKSENILITIDKQQFKTPLLKIIDFDLSRDMQQSSDRSLVCNTPGFCAPETVLFSRKEGDILKPDSWSIAMVLHDYLTGNLPIIYRARNGAVDSNENIMYVRNVQQAYAFNKDLCGNPMDPELRQASANAATHDVVVFICLLAQTRPENRMTPMDFLQSIFIPNTEEWLAPLAMNQGIASG